MTADALQRLRELPRFFMSTMKMRMIPAVQLDRSQRERMERDGELWVSDSQLRLELDAVLAAVPGAQEMPKERELCRLCQGNGVLKIPNGTCVCTRCDGDCWEPSAVAALPHATEETR